MGLTVLFQFTPQFGDDQIKASMETPWYKSHVTIATVPVIEE